MLLLISDDGGAVFGGFMDGVVFGSGGGSSASLPASPGRSSRAAFQGSADCFVFSLAPQREVFAATGDDTCYIIAADDRLAMGGGDGGSDGGAGGFAFCVDDALDRGTSARSSTFGNAPLAAADVFHCVDVELWAWTGLGQSFA